MKSRHLIFSHIPKTAGTSVRIRMKEALEGVLNQYIEIGVYDLGNWVRPRDFPGIEVPENWAFIYGHIIAQQISANHAMHQDPTNTIFMSFVRDPVDRLISTYNYIATTPNHPLHEKCTTTDQEAFFITLSENERDIQYRYLNCGKHIEWNFLIAPSDRVGDTCAEAFEKLTGETCPPSFFDQRLNKTKEFTTIGKAQKLRRNMFTEKQISDIYQLNKKDAEIFKTVKDNKILHTNPV